MTTNAMGKRYVCSVCGAEVIVTRGGKEQKTAMSCHGQPMHPKEG